MRKLAISLVTLALLPLPVRADAPPEEETGQEEAQAEEPDEERNKHPILFYLPNRVFDLLDVVRARARVGPGVAVSGRAKIPWPVGIENYAGADVSVFGVSTEGFGPGYGVAEVGAGVQAGAVGIDVGIDPLEALDLILGFVLIDIRDDDF